MSVIEAENPLEGALNASRVRRKANNTRQLRSKAARIAKGSPEVMVKITGFGKGVQHVKSHLDYISRHGKVELETNRGEILEGKAEIKDFFNDWASDFGDSRRRKNQRDTLHMIVSMPEGTPDGAVRAGAREFARNAFGANHEYVFVLHTDQPHPHVHITVKMLGHDGMRLNPRKADLQRWREEFAEKMRDEGIDAEATPRAVRGRVKKAERQLIRHIERGDKTHAPRVSRVKASQVRQVAQELAGEARGESAPARAWETAIKARQAATRTAWLGVAAELDREARDLPEKANVRPDYDRIDSRTARAAQRAAAVYQSNLEGTGRKAPAAAIARMRDVSRLGVVQHERPAQVLLLADAPGGVGRDGAADHALRRPGAGLDRLAERSRRVIGATGPVSPQESLAGTIRGFVKGMPTIDTMRHELKQQLVQEFSKPQELRSEMTASRAHQVGDAQKSSKGPER